MKILLVTSEVTYVPGNYFDLFEKLFASEAASHLAGLVILKNLSPKLMASAAGLAAMGCPRVAGCMVANIFKLPLRKRERLFESRGLPVLRASSMNEPLIVEWVKDQGIDLIVNMRTRCIYKAPILRAPRLGCINIHHGILPTYRGTLCDLYALSEGRPAGFTIHEMNEKIDAGRILLRQEVSLPGEKDYVGYLSRTGREEGRALGDLILEIARLGKVPDGQENICENPVFTRNPDRNGISRMRDAGIAL